MRVKIKHHMPKKIIFHLLLFCLKLILGLACKKGCYVTEQSQKPVLGIRIQIRMFFGLPDPDLDPLVKGVKGTDPDPSPDPSLFSGMC